MAESQLGTLTMWTRSRCKKCEQAREVFRRLKVRYKEVRCDTPTGAISFQRLGVVPPPVYVTRNEVTTDLKEALRDICPEDAREDLETVLSLMLPAKTKERISARALIDNEEEDSD